MARRNVGQKKSYAWVVSPTGNVRSFALKAGCEHRVVAYQANAMDKRTFDNGRFQWFIRPEVAHEGWLKLEDAYAQDSRPALSTKEENGKPAGFNRYMEYCDAAMARKTPKEVITQQRPNGQNYTRTIPQQYPLNGLPEIAIRRIKGLVDDKWKASEFPAPNLEIEGVEKPDAKAKRAG